MNRAVVLVALSSLHMCWGTFDSAAAQVTTQRYDNARTGQTLSETTLDVSNVNADRFGKLFTRKVDDQVYAQPLYMPNVRLPNGETHNVLYIATVNNTVYAFDADDPETEAPLWTVNLTPADARPVKATDVGQNCVPYRDFSDNIGIVGSPVIDAESGTMFLVSRAKTASGFVQRLHALDIASGAERADSPVEIVGRTPGSGSGATDGILTFDPAIHNQRAALLLANGAVYIAWASHCDTGPYHGWLMAYDASTLEQRFARTVTPDGHAGGIWQSNSGPSADEDGNLYLSTGNGTASGHTGGRDFGSAFLKLSPSGEVLDWFIPHNFAALNEVDLDLGTTGVLVVPDTNLLIGGAKESKLYVFDRDAMGGFNAENDSQIFQLVEEAVSGGLFGTPTYWAGPGGPHVYVWGGYDVGKMYALREAGLEPKPVSATTAMSDIPGGSLTVSADGARAGTGIVWAVTAEENANHQTVPGVLRAYDATDLSRELWNSKQNVARDGLGLLAKFNTPIVANGKVYVPTFSKEIAVYGLLPAAPQ